MATNFESQPPTLVGAEEDYTHKPPVIDMSNAITEDPEELGGAGKHQSRKNNPWLLGLLGLCGVGLLAWFGLSLFEPKKVVSVLPPEPKVQAKSTTTTVEPVNPSASTVNMAAPSTSNANANANAISATTSATPTAATTASPVSASTTVTTTPPAQNAAESKPKEVVAVTANESAKKASPEAQPAAPAKAAATTEEKPVQAKKRTVQKDKPSWFVVNP